MVDEVDRSVKGVTAECCADVGEFEGILSPSYALFRLDFCCMFVCVCMCVCVCVRVCVCVLV